jgi:Predicted SAM-dependent methyltransferase
MGGTLMCRILDACPIPLMGAKSVVLQPMRAQDDIRSYLHTHGYHITDDRIVSEHGRYYQMLRATPGDSPELIPDGFPKDFFDLGYRSFADRDPLLPEYCSHLLSIYARMCRAAVGSPGEPRLRRKIDALHAIIEQMRTDE